VDEAQRLREIVLDSLDQEQNANGFARYAYRSRTQFYRVFRALIEETPIAMRASVSANGQPEEQQSTQSFRSF
jgi:hypothetical protein